MAAMTGGPSSIRRFIKIVRLGGSLDGVRVYFPGAWIANNVDLLAMYNTLLATIGVEYTELPMLITPIAGSNSPSTSFNAFFGSLVSGKIATSPSSSPM